MRSGPPIPGPAAIACRMRIMMRPGKSISRLPPASWFGAPRWSVWAVSTRSYRPAWFEDVDLCRRIWSLGGRIVFEPGAVFVHQGGSSLRRLTPREFLQYFHTNQLRYFYKHHGDAYGMRVRRLVIAGNVPSQRRVAVASACCRIRPGPRRQRRTGRLPAISRSTARRADESSGAGQHRHL